MYVPTCTAAASRVIPCDLWMVTAHAGLTGTCTRKNGIPTRLTLNP